MCSLPSRGSCIRISIGQNDFIGSVYSNRKPRLVSRGFFFILRPEERSNNILETILVMEFLKSNWNSILTILTFFFLVLKFIWEVSKDRKEKKKDVKVIVKYHSTIDNKGNGAWIKKAYFEMINRSEKAVTIDYYKVILSKQSHRNNQDTSSANSTIRIKIDSGEKEQINIPLNPGFQEEIKVGEVLCKVIVKDTFDNIYESELTSITN